MKLFIKGTNSFICKSIILVMVFNGIMITGCKKPVVTYENFDATNLRVINGFPDKTKVKFYLDTFNLTLKIPTTSYINYGGTTIYYVVKSGLRKASFVSLNTKDTFAVADVQLMKNKSYTLFLKGEPISPSSIALVEDDLIQPALNKAKIRVANLSPNSGKVDVTFQLDDPLTQPVPKPEVKLLENIDVGMISGYKLLDVPTSLGNFTPNYYNIRMYEAGTQNLLGTGTRIDVRGSLIYTIVCRGKKGGSPAFTFDFRKDWAEF